MSRRKAREMALQALFQLDFNEVQPASALDTVFAESGKASEKTKSYAEHLVMGTQQNIAAIDGVVGDLSTEWTIDRMPSVDRNIARIAVYELEYGEEELSPNVVINEAVELAKTYGTDDSSRFINGILGALIKKTRSKP